MEDDRDIVVFSDDEGNEFELEVIDYFDHEEQEYAVLVDADEPEEGEEEVETEVYIMKVIVNGDMEEFVPADEDKLDELIKIVEERMETCDCDECDDECDCHDDDCGCGCHDDK